MSGAWAVAVSSLSSFGDGGRRLAVGRLLRDTVEDLHLQWPPADFDVEEQKARLDAVPV